MKKFWVLCMVALIAIVAGCASSGSGSPAGSSTDTSSNSTPSQSQQTNNNNGNVNDNTLIELTFWTTEKDLLVDAVDAFHEAHPNIRVTAEYMGGYDDMAAKVMAGVVAGNLPHVVQLGQRHGIPQIADSGKLLPIESFMSEEDITDIYPAFWDRFTYKDQKWTIPFQSSTPMMYINRTMFDEAGLQTPSSWEDVIHAAQVLSGDGVWGMNWHTDSPWYFQPMVWNRGGELISMDGELGINSPAAVETLASIQQLVHDYKVMPQNQFNTSREDFVSGKLAMYFRSGASLSGVKRDVGDKFDVEIAFLPMVDERWIPIGGNSLGIFQSDEAHQQAAWTFIEFLTSAEMTAKISMDTGYIPVRQSALDLPDFQNHLTVDPDFKVTIDQMQYLRNQPISPADALIWSGIVDALEQVHSRADADPQRILDDLQSEVSEYLRNYE